MGQLLIWGTLVTSWRLWFMVLLEPFSDFPACNSQLCVLYSPKDHCWNPVFTI